MHQIVKTNLFKLRVMYIDTENVHVYVECAYTFESERSTITILEAIH